MTFFQNFPNCLKRPKKTLFDSWPTVAWPPTTVAWPFSDFFQKFSQLLPTSKKRCLTVGRRSRDLQPLSRDRSATFFKNFPNCLKRPKNVVWQSADGRVTSDHCRVTVQRLFSKFFLIAWNVGKTLFESQRTVAWLSGYFASVFFFVRLPYASVCCLSHFIFFFYYFLQWFYPFFYIAYSWLVQGFKKNNNNNTH